MAITDVLLILARLGTPLAVLFGVGYLIQRYYRQREKGLALGLAAGRVDAMYNRALPRQAAAAACWQIKGCSLAERSSCPAYPRTYLSCWLTVKLAKGDRLKHECLSCPLYETGLVEGAGRGDGGNGHRESPDRVRQGRIPMSKNGQQIAVDGYGFVEEIASEPAGECIRWCVQCGTCSGSCPNVLWMDHSPRKIIALVRAGKRQEVLSSNSMWSCASCYLCTVRCPKGIQLPELMHVLACMGTREGLANGRVSTPAMHRTFVDAVKSQGRVHELALMGRFFLRTNPLAALKMMPVGLRLLLHGRLPLTAEKIKGTDQLRTIVKEAQAIGGGK